MQHQWSGPEDFALNAQRMAAIAARVEAMTPKDLPPPLDYLAKRDAMAREMAETHPCLPLHQITASQFRRFRDWHAFEAISTKGGRAQAEWHVKAALELEDFARKRDLFARH
jgi:hypothetical protein